MFLRGFFADNMRSRLFRWRPYVFTVTALATFYTGLVGASLATARYTAVSRATPHPVASRGVDRQTLEQAATRLQSLELIQAALEVPRRAGASRSEATTLPGPAEIRRHLEVTIERADHGRPQIVLRYTGRSREVAEQVVQRLAWMLPQATAPAEPNESLQQEWSSLRRTVYEQLAEASQQESQAYRALEAFLQVRMGGVDESPALSSATSELYPPQVYEAPPQNAPTARSRSTGRNPVWQELHYQFEQLRTERNDLLTRYTEEHPRVLALEKEIRVLRERMAQTPESLEAEPAPDSIEEADAEGIPRHEAASAAGTVTWASQRGAASKANEPANKYDEAQRARLQALQQSYTAAREAHRAAQHSLMQQLARATESPPPAEAPVWLVDPPTSKLQPVPNVVQFTLLVLAVSIGGTASWAAGSRSLRQIFTTGEQVSETLRLPLVGVVDPPTPAKRRRHLQTRLRVVCGVTYASQCLLAVLVFSLLFSVLIGDPFAEHLAAQPWESITSVLTRCGL